jgi:thioredoxin 2
MASILLDAKGLVIVCPTCGRKNRMGWDHIGRAHRCAQCRTELSAPAAPVDVPDEALFDSLVSRASVPVVVDYWAPWCQPCRMVAPEVEKVAQRNAGRLLVVKVNTDDVPQLGERYGIRSIPTMAVFSGGREVARTSGARPAADIEAFVADSVGRS